ncbi:MAG: hypothetical protein LH609_23645, partial [Rudanella sp.]|nr:hypothetical protein [Rudanella sp.]
PPNAGLKRTWKDKLTRPGYYWLAYDWQNLFFSCEICNRKHKNNFFPVVDEPMRAKNHSFDVSLEEPAILHPSLDDPEKHLQFKRYMLTYKTTKGENSIKAYGLNRKKLREKRSKYLDTVELNDLYWDYDPDELTDKQKHDISKDMNRPWPDLERIIRKARAFLAIAATDQKPFSLMVRQNFPHLPYEPQSRV